MEPRLRLARVATCVGSEPCQWLTLATLERCIRGPIIAWRVPSLRSQVDPTRCRSEARRVVHYRLRPEGDQGAHRFAMPRMRALSPGLLGHALPLPGMPFGFGKPSQRESVPGVGRRDARERYWNKGRCFRGGDQQ